MANYRVLLLAVVLAAALQPEARGQGSNGPDTVTVQSGELTLRGLLWRPGGRGPFPAVLFNHGSYGRGDPLVTEEPAAIGPVFARHGYVFLFLCRQGVGLSVGQGTADGDLMASALAVHGQEGRNRVQLELMEGEELNEALGGLALLRALPDVNPQRVAVAGHSFGGSLTLFLAARDTSLRAAVIFAGAAHSWERSPELRARLLAAVGRARAPVLFLHAANDYATSSGKSLATEMQRLRRPHRLKIYPAVGRTAREGHNLVFRSVSTWEPDVFAFLHRYVAAVNH